MKILLEKVSNTRDLGGIKSAYGTVKPNKLLRSGHLSVATEADCATLVHKHNLRRIIDLRTDREIENNPDVVMDGVEWRNVSIIAATTFGISYEKLDGAGIAEKLQAGIERMIARGETPSEHMRILYRNFIEQDYCHRGFGRFLKLLANEPIDGATLWHCSAGKDRVGSCTALLLHCLGVNREGIMRDYLITNEMTTAHRESILNKVRPYISEELMALEQSMLTVDESYLDSFWCEIERRFGSVDKFISHCGVTENDIKKLRENYLEQY